MAATPGSDRHRRNARIATIRVLCADLIRSGVRSDWLPVWLPGLRTISASRIWIAVSPGERLSDCSSATRRIRMNDCLRAVHHRSDNNFEYMELPVLTAPRARFEPAAYCLGGTSGTSPGVAGWRLMCCSSAPIVAGRGSASPGFCVCWLPVWLPTTSLAWLTFELSNPVSHVARAGAASHHIHQVGHCRRGR
jgi:hypothetical protein